MPYIHKFNNRDKTSKHLKKKKWAIKCEDGRGYWVTWLTSIVKLKLFEIYGVFTILGRRRRRRKRSIYHFRPLANMFTLMGFQKVDYSMRNSKELKVRPRYLERSIHPISSLHLRAQSHGPHHRSCQVQIDWGPTDVLQ